MNLLYHELRATVKEIRFLFKDLLYGFIDVNNLFYCCSQDAYSSGDISFVQKNFLFWIALFDIGVKL